MANNNNKVKSLLKGLRFISHIFDNNDKDEIQIGNPTDVKHVAHIGWDGPTENSPSWMNDFQAVPGNSIQRNFEDSNSMERGSGHVNYQNQENGTELPKSSKRQSHSMGHIKESRAKEKSDRPRQPKKASKNSQPNDSCNESQPMEQSMHTNTESLQGSDLPPKKHHEHHKKSRSKISKDGSNVGGSSKSRSKAQPKDHNSDLEHSHHRPSSNSMDKYEPFEEDGQLHRGSNEHILNSYHN